MRVSFVSQWFDPEVGSAAIPGAIARALQSRGHEIDVVTSFPNYPHGRLYPGYRVRPLKREVLRGIRVHRMPSYPSHDRSAIRRTVSFLSFMLSASTLGAFLARRAEVALVYSTPATVGWAGVVLRRVLRRPFVLYIQDMWPDTVIATGMVPLRYAKPVEWALGHFCQRIYRAASRIAVISPGMKDLLVARGVEPAKIDLIYNWVDEDIFRPVQRMTAGSSFQIMYAGSVGDVQGLDVAVRALTRLDDADEVIMRIVGDGVARAGLEKLAAELGIEDRVIFEGPRAITDMADVMATADMQLVCLRDDPLFHLTMPSKIQAIMACGLPLIVCAPGDAAALVAEANAGISVPPGDVDALADAFRRASRLPVADLAAAGARGRAYYERHLSAATGAERLERALIVAAGTANRWSNA